MIQNPNWNAEIIRLVRNKFMRMPPVRNNLNIKVQNRLKENIEGLYYIKVLFQRKGIKKRS